MPETAQVWGQVANYLHMFFALFSKVFFYPSIVLFVTIATSQNDAHAEKKYVVDL